MEVDLLEGLTSRLGVGLLVGHLWPSGQMLKSFFLKINMLLKSVFLGHLEKVIGPVIFRCSDFFEQKNPSWMKATVF